MEWNLQTILGDRIRQHNVNWIDSCCSSHSALHTIQSNPIETNQIISSVAMISGNVIRSNRTVLYLKLKSQISAKKHEKKKEIIIILVENVVLHFLLIHLNLNYI